MREDLRVRECGSAPPWRLGVWLPIGLGSSPSSGNTSTAGARSTWTKSSCCREDVHSRERWSGRLFSLLRLGRSSSWLSSTSPVPRIRAHNQSRRDSSCLHRSASALFSISHLQNPPCPLPPLAAYFNNKRLFSTRGVHQRAKCNPPARQHLSLLPHSEASHWFFIASVQIVGVYARSVGWPPPVLPCESSGRGSGRRR